MLPPERMCRPIMDIRKLFSAWRGHLMVRASPQQVQIKRYRYGEWMVSLRAIAWHPREAIFSVIVVTLVGCLLSRGHLTVRVSFPWARIRLLKSGMLPREISSLPIAAIKKWLI